VNLLVLAALWPFRRFAVALNFLFTAKSRPALAAWVVASLAVGASAFAGNAALADRKALASSSILGIPTMIQAPPAVAAKGSVEEQLAQAQAEAQLWKKTLDDERLRQEYLEKSAREEFNQAPVTALDLSRTSSMGGKNAPIQVVSFSDFMCPFCRDLAIGLKNYVPASGERVRVHYKHFPLDTTCNRQVGRTVHQGACELALGGICAEESGRFWEYHDAVFAQPWTRPATREDVLRLGGEAGLDKARLTACLGAAATRGLLAREIEEGGRLGIGSTPTLFVNGRKLRSVNVFFLAVEEERKRLGLPPLNRPAP
jgi:protein-disulfide isomerase